MVRAESLVLAQCNQLRVGTMSLKHGVWISALPGGVEGGAVTISRGEKQMSLGQ